MTLVSGPEEGRNGASALDLWRAQTNRPNATLDDMMAALAGKDGASFLDQWRASIGPATATMEDVRKALTVKGDQGADFLTQWRLAFNKPTATMTDVAAALKGESVKGDQGPAGLVPIYYQGALQKNAQIHIYDATSDGNGNWTVDCTASKFLTVLDANATAWKDVDVATDQVDVRRKTMTTTKITGSVVQGARITSALVTLGAATVTKVAGVPVKVAILGTVAPA